MTLQRTLVVHHYPGIGDLVWHIPYIRAIACSSRGGKVTIMARPSCKATDVLEGETCIEEIIEHDYRRRNKTKGLHDGLIGMFRLFLDLRQEKFDRIVIFSARPRYAILALLAGIPNRLGFGFRFNQRLYLTKPPYIRPYDGAGSPVYAEATSFAVAHGFVDGPVVPKIKVPVQKIDEASSQLSRLPRPRYALAIGASEPKKNWGGRNFLELARRLTDAGCGVLFLGGPDEQEEAERLFTNINGLRDGYFQVMCQTSVLKSAAALKVCDFCIGNDTGALNIAVACDVPTLGLFGNTLPLTHDALLHAISSRSMNDISVVAVMSRLVELEN